MLSASFFQSAAIGACVVASQPAGIGIREEIPRSPVIPVGFCPLLRGRRKWTSCFRSRASGASCSTLRAGIAVEAIFVALYIAVKPHREPTLIKAGNTAAVVSPGGAVLGFTLPPASAIANSVAIVDMAV